MRSKNTSSQTPAGVPSAGTTYFPPKNGSPCPTCGHCPTCGRRNDYYPSYPYYYPSYPSYPDYQYTGKVNVTGGTTFEPNKF
jgi:hypothetical protein